MFEKSPVLLSWLTWGMVQPSFVALLVLGPSAVDVWSCHSEELAGGLRFKRLEDPMNGSALASSFGKDRKILP